MKKHIFLIITIAVYAVFLLTSVAHAKLPIKREPTEIPSELKKITIVSQISSYLDSPNREIRIAAVKRLAQIGDSEAVGLLVRAFDKEPYETGMEVLPGVKEEVISALRKIGGEKARVSLITILNIYIENGPQLRGKGGLAWEDGLYLHVVEGALEALGNWKDNEVFKIFDDVNNNNNLFWSVRQEAYRQYVRIKMHRERIVLLKDSIRYLIDIQKSCIENKEYKHFTSLEAIKERAITKILKSYGKPALLYLEESANELPLKGEQYNIITRVIKDIKKQDIKQEKRRKSKP